MMKKITMAALIASAAAASANAGFVAMEVDASTTVQGGNTYFVYRVFAKFNNVNDTVLNVYGMTTTPAGSFPGAAATAVRKRRASAGTRHTT